MAARGAPALVAELCGGGAAAARALEACKALCVTSEGRAELSRCGAIDATVGLLGSSDDAENVLLPACQLLNELCFECPPNAAAAIAAGCLPALARVCNDEEQPVHVALEAYKAVLAAVIDDMQEGLLAAGAHLEAAAAAGVVDAAARLVARPRGGPGDACLAEALSVLVLATGRSAPVADRVAASGALSGAVALLRSSDDGLSLPAIVLVHRTTELSPAAARAVGLDPAAAPALVEVLKAPPAGGGALPDSPYFAASVLGRMAQQTMGRARVAGAPNAVAADVRRAGGVPRMVELLRAVLGGGAMPEATRNACRVLIVHALSGFLVLDAESRPAALAAGAAPLFARVLAGVGAGPRGLDGDHRELGALHALAALGDVPRVGRAALAAQPGLAATAARILGAVQAGWLQPVPPGASDSAVGGAAALLGAMIQSGDALGITAARETAAAGGALFLVRLGRRGPGTERRSCACPCRQLGN
jgi:hypothetical protein